MRLEDFSLFCSIWHCFLRLIFLSFNADRIAPFLDDAFNDRLKDGLTPQHQWLSKQLDESFGTSFKEMMEEQNQWFRRRNTTVLWIPVLIIFMIPVYRNQKRIRRGEGSEEPDLKAMKRVLNLPLFLFLLPIVGGFWKLLVEFSAIDKSLEILGDDNSKGVFLVSFFLATSVAGYFNLWFTERYINRRLAKFVFTGQSLFDLKKAPAPGLTMRVFLMIVSLAAIPVLLNIYIPASFNIRWFSGFFDQPNPDFVSLAAAIAPMMIIIVLNLTFLIMQIAGIAIFRKSIQRPVDGLISSMKDVARGKFETRSTVLSADEIGQLKGHFNQMVEGLEEREKLRKTFGQFVSQEIVEKVMLERDDVLQGEEIISTVMFTDIRSFTSFSESRSPREVIEFLNRYFSYMVRPIDKYGGVVNKFIGDSIMAIFSPVFGLEENHATAALQAALEMREALETFNSEEDFETIRYGLGIHTGPLVAGNVGAEERKEYTVIGDTVNVTSRIESQTKIEGVDILVSEDFRKRLNEECSNLTGVSSGCIDPDDYNLSAHEPVKIRGKSDSYVLYSVTDKTGD